MNTSLRCSTLFLSLGLATANAGPESDNWQTQTTGNVGIPKSISTVSIGVCWMAGTGGSIVRTVDGGNTWSQINSGIIGTREISVIEGVNEALAFAVATDTSTSIYRTSGAPWEKVYSQTGGSIFAIKLYNATNGLAVGNPVAGRWTILQTTNGGDTWLRMVTEPLQIGNASGGTRFGTCDTSWVWFYDSEGRQYWSTNRGTTWTVSGTISGLTFQWWNDRHTALFVTANQVYRYSLGWVSAGTTPHPVYQPTGLVGTPGTTEFWLAQDALYYTANSASSWTAAPPHGLNKSVGLIDIVVLGGNVSAWATGAGDTVYHYLRIQTNVEEPQQIPEQLSLSQNYPNPFNPETRIGFRIREAGFVTLKVFDLLGREVATLANEVKQPGEYNVAWDASGLPSGVYFYRLISSQFIHTKRMLLLR